MRTKRYTGFIICRV